MKKHTVEEFIPESEIQNKVRELGQQISKDFAGEKLLAVGVLKGSVIFMSDLVRHIEGVDVELAFITVSSYVGETTKSSGTVQLICDIDKPVKNLNVLLIEDIIDTGITLKYLSEMIALRKPKSFSVCTFLDKPSRRLSDVKPQYCGFSIPDKFVVGYGLDYDGKYRNLKNIGVVKF